MLDAPEAGLPNQIQGRVSLMTYRGTVLEYELRTEGGLAIVSRRVAPGLGGLPGPLVPKS